MDDWCEYRETNRGRATQMTYENVIAAFKASADMVVKLRYEVRDLYDFGMTWCVGEMQ